MRQTLSRLSGLPGARGRPARGLRRRLLRRRGAARPAARAGPTAPPPPPLPAPGPVRRRLGRPGEEDIWGLTSEPCPRPGADKARCGVVSRTTTTVATWTRLGRLDVGTTTRRHDRFRERGALRRRPARLGLRPEPLRHLQRRAAVAARRPRQSRSWPSSRSGTSAYALVGVVRARRRELRRPDAAWPKGRSRPAAGGS